MNTDIPTPETDAQYKEYARRDNDVKCVSIDFARSLERRLAIAVATLMKLSTTTYYEERDAINECLAQIDKLKGEQK